MLEELRAKTKESLESEFSAAFAGDRKVFNSIDGFICESWNEFDPEFITQDIEVAINYLYPEP